jgi:hypothetical protein
MLGPFHVQGAAESDAPVRLGVRAHVPGTRRDRAQADEERIKKGLAVVETPSEGIRLWAVFKKGPVHGPLPENPGTGRAVVGILELRPGRA